MTLQAPDATAGARLASLQNMHGPDLLQYLVKRTLGDRRLAEDLLQETFLRAWRYLEQHDDTDLVALRPWLFTVARRLMIDVLRARRARPTEVMYEDLSRVSATNDSIGELLASEVVRSALMALRADQRFLLIQLYYHGRTPAEVGEILNIPVGTVKSRSHLAKRALRANLEAAGHLES
jgi:RNA polymerase sigma-70 factor (ECF subfamily)